MAGHHFISYSPIDAQQFVFDLYDALKGGKPSVDVWLDKRDLKAGLDWGAQIVDAISTCSSLLFVVTADSVEHQSVCSAEWARALKYKKPVIPIKLYPNAELPFRLENRHCIDFTGDFDIALSSLRDHLRLLESPKGVLASLKERLMDARRDLRRTTDSGQEKRIRDEIELLGSQIVEQRRIVENPEEENQKSKESIQRGIERERRPERPITPVHSTKFINQPPTVAPSYFQDRFVETGLIGKFLKDDAVRIITVVGRAGVGKTAMVCRFLKSLEFGRLPDDAGQLSIDGIVYLSSLGSRRINFPHLFEDLTKLLPEETAKKMEELYSDPQISVVAKMRALLGNFHSGRIVVLLDNFEDVIESRKLEILDEELDEALRILLDSPQHMVKLIITTRVAPRNLLLLQPGRQRRIDLDTGLKSPFAENILRAMDEDGKLGLKSGPDDLLSQARECTRGYPRALEALFAILAADRETSLQEILEDAEDLLPENVVEALAGEAFNRLDALAQQVMQALAIYAYPVNASAIDYLLQPYISGVNSAPVLNRLLNMQFVRKEGGRYYVHPVDRSYALRRTPVGEKEDRNKTEKAVFSKYALFNRAADYFKEIRTPRETWASIEDLTPQLLEFEMRCIGLDYDMAAEVLLEIDFEYLLRWGHYNLVAQSHIRLLDRVADRALAQASIGNLGTAFNRMGNLREAIECYQLALDAAIESNDAANYIVWLSNLGSCYQTLGQTKQAMDNYLLALEISREIEDRGAEAVNLSGLGSCYQTLGQTKQAMDNYYEALEICREVGDLGNEAVNIASLGSCRQTLGQTKQAMDNYYEALEICREIGDRGDEAVYLGSLGSCRQTLGQTKQAMDNFNQALEICREIGDRGNEAVYLGSLGSCRQTLGQTDEAIENYQQALDLCREIGARGNEAANLGSLGSCLQTLGRTKQAMDNYGQALEICREIGDRGGEAVYLSSLGDCYQTLGRTEKAMDNYQQALDLCREIGARGNEAVNLGSLGSCYQTLGQTKQAMENYQQALDLCRDIGDRGGEAVYLGSLGDCYQTLGRMDEAMENYQQALDLCRDIGARGNEAVYLGSLGDCFQTLGRTDEAMDNYQEALDICRAIGNQGGEAVNLGSLGSCYQTLGRTEDAMENYQKALDLCREIGNRGNEAVYLGSLGDCYRTLGRTDEAMENYQQALEICREIGNRGNEAVNLGSLGSCYQTLGRTDEAMKKYQEALDIGREIGNRGNEAVYLGSLGDCYQTLGRTDEAMENYQQALQICREIGNRGNEAVNLGSLGDCYQTLGRTEKALDHYQEALEICGEIGNRGGEGIYLGSIGGCFQTLGRTGEALENYRRALDISRFIGDRVSEAASLNDLGNYYGRAGDFDRAIRKIKKALKISREARDSSGIATYLNNLGVAYEDLGLIPKALEHYENALDMYKRIGDRSGQALCIGNVAGCQQIYGDFTSAIDGFREALKINREIKDRRGEASALCNLGSCQAEIGDADEAMSCYQRSLSLYQMIGDYGKKAMVFREIADLHLNQHQLSEAVENYKKALKIADDIMSIRDHHHGWSGLAEAYLETDDPAKAKTASETACKYKLPNSEYKNSTILGISYLLLGDMSKSRSAFLKAFEQADGLISNSEKNFGAWDGKALAICGLCLTGDDKAVSESIRAFEKARAVTNAKSVVARVLRLLDKMREVDESGMLSPVRTAAEGINPEFDEGN